MAFKVGTALLNKAYTNIGKFRTEYGPTVRMDGLKYTHKEGCAIIEKFKTRKETK